MAAPDALALEEVGPLLDLVRGAEPSVRLAALEVMVRLPFQAEAWARVAELALELLDEPLPAEDDRRRLLSALARIPLAKVRSRLRDLAADPAHPDHDRAVEALREVLDPFAAMDLLEAAEPEPEPAAPGDPDLARVQEILAAWDPSLSIAGEASAISELVNDELEKIVGDEEAQRTPAHPADDLVSSVAALGRAFTPRPDRLFGAALKPRGGARLSHDLLDQLAWTAVQPSPRDALRVLPEPSLSTGEALDRLGFLRRGLDVAAAGVPVPGASRAAAARIRLLDEPGPRTPATFEPTDYEEHNPERERARDFLREWPSLQEEGPQEPADVRARLEALPSPPPRRIVSTGFEREGGGELVDRTLQAGSPYRFFVEIDRGRAAGAVGDFVLPVGVVPAGRVLQVALFPFEGELACGPDAALGEFVFRDDGMLAVRRQPGSPPLAEPAGVRLRFSISTAARRGEQRLCCNLYLDRVLLLSLIVTARVTDVEVESAGALRARADYVFSGTLDPAQLRDIRPHLLSMVDAKVDGTHEFCLLGGADFRREVRLQDTDLQGFVEESRKKLRWASWNEEEEPGPGQKVAYGYARPPPRAVLAQHLFSLARAGRRTWDVLMERFAHTVDEKLALRARMRRPGRVQIVAKESAHLVVPAAMFYDRHPRSSLPDEELRLCDAFTAALEAPGPLEDAACFRGECPRYEDEDVVCPSGFWGFRHELGMPCSVREGTNAAVVIAGSRPLSILAGVATDLELWQVHLRELQPLGFDVDEAVKSVPEFLARYRAGDQQLVYLYGHGGVSGVNPYFVIGGPETELLLRDSLNEFIPAESRHPLVFLNGCRSTGLSPERAIDLVSGFVMTGRASGVIGTEISVVEQLATEFARELLQRFVVQRLELGAATRGARLALLKKGNPLGLAYIPYAPVDLRLVDPPAPAAQA